MIWRKKLRPIYFYIYIEGKFNMHFLGKIFVLNWMTKVQNEMMKQEF